MNNDNMIPATRVNNEIQELIKELNCTIGQHDTESERQIRNQAALMCGGAFTTGDAAHLNRLMHRRSAERDELSGKVSILLRLSRRLDLIPASEGGPP